uniref:Uncharacterized protein n=1 Tax=Cercocebus atys TaxID=9531 RepID=A0A2K5LXJ6_CERAT
MLSQKPKEKHNFLNCRLPLNLAIKPYLALKGFVDTESTQEKRETGDEENSATFPIGRRDFNMFSDHFYQNVNL